MTNTTDAVKDPKACPCGCALLVPEGMNGEISTRWRTLWKRLDPETWKQTTRKPRRRR